MINRRTVLRGAFGVLGAVTVGSIPAAASGGGPFTSVGVNKFEFGGDDPDVRVDKAPAPAGGGAATYVHSEPSDKTTNDYVTTVGNVDDEGLTLGEFSGSNPSTLTYDYYGGAKNEVSAPDEVWLLLVEPDGTTHEVYHTGNDGDPNGQTWETRDVAAEMRGEGLNSGFNWFEITDSGVSSLGETLVDEFPDDTEINRIGAGRGTVGGGDVLDIYYRNIEYNGTRISTFPTGRGR